MGVDLVVLPESSVEEIPRQQDLGFEPQMELEAAIATLMRPSSHTKARVSLPVPVHPGGWGEIRLLTVLGN